MVNAVVVEETKIQHGWKVEYAEESNGRHQLLRRHPRHASGPALHVLVVPRDHLGRSLGLVFGCLHVEIEVGNSVQKLNIAIGYMSRQFLCSTGAWIGSVARSPVGHGREHPPRD